MRVVEKKPRGEGTEELGEAEGARRATGGSPSGAPPAGVGTGGEKPDVEGVATARRRGFTAEDKRRIVREADRGTKPGEDGAPLARGGLYSSPLTTWGR